MEPPAEPIQTAQIQISVSGRTLSLELSLPLEPVAPRRLLPLYQALTDRFVEVAEQAARDNGETVSCKKGCGQCCRQLVPISPMETYALRDLIAAMPEAQRTRVLTRFQEGVARAEAAGMIEALIHPETLASDTILAFAKKYFDLGIACPFLDGESCSIHSDRPLGCREYLVTSPAAECASPTPERVRMVPVTAQVSRAVRLLSTEPARPRWVPLLLAVAWAETVPEAVGPHPASMMVREVFQHVLGREVPAPPR